MFALAFAAAMFEAPAGNPALCKKVLRVAVRVAPPGKYCGVERTSGRFATTTFAPTACNFLMIAVMSVCSCAGVSDGDAPCDSEYFSKSFALSHTVANV